MMNEKKKYIDIDSVVGNLDEVTVKDLRKQAGMSRKDFCNRFGRGWNSKIGIYSSRRIPTAESVTGKGGWIYRKMGNHEKRVPTKTQTSCLFFDAFDG